MPFQNKTRLIAGAVAIGALAGAAILYAITRKTEIADSEAPKPDGPRIGCVIDTLPPMIASEVRRCLCEGGILICGASKTDPDDVFIGLISADYITDQVDDLATMLSDVDVSSCEIFPTIIPLDGGSKKVGAPVNNLVRSVLLQGHDFRNAYDADRHIARNAGVRSISAWVNDGIISIMPSCVKHLASGYNTKDYMIGTFSLG